MTCNFVHGAVICTSDSFVNLEPYGAKVWCEYHRWMGPVFYRSKNALQEIRVPSKKTWNAFNSWFNQSSFARQKVVDHSEPSVILDLSSVNQS